MDITNEIDSLAANAGVITARETNLDYYLKCENLTIKVNKILDNFGNLDG